MPDLTPVTWILAGALAGRLEEFRLGLVDYSVEQDRGLSRD